MNFDEAMDACAGHPATELGYPFGEGVHVFKVVSKVFAILGDEAGRARITLKGPIPRMPVRSSPRSPRSPPATT